MCGCHRPPSCCHDDIQARICEKLVCIALLELDDGDARLDLWCPDGMQRYNVCALPFFHAMAEDSATAGGA
jgi:hypothetical protein